MTFAEKLLKLRKREGLSQEELASRLEVSRQAVSRWELGTAMPDAPKLFQLSRVFGVTADYLLDDAQEEYEAQQSAVQKQPDMGEKPVRRHLAEKVTGGIVAGLGAAGLLIMGIFNSVKPVHIFPTFELHPDGTETMVEAGSAGLKAFLSYYNLEWLWVLCIACIPVGLTIAFAPVFSRHLKKYQ